MNASIFFNIAIVAVASAFLLFLMHFSSLSHKANIFSILNSFSKTEIVLLEPQLHNTLQIIFFIALLKVPAAHTYIGQKVNPYRFCKQSCSNPQNVRTFLDKSKVPIRTNVLLR